MTALARPCLAERIRAQRSPLRQSVGTGLGLKPLHLATLKGSAGAVTALLRAGAAPEAGTCGSPLGQHLTAGSTALHIAAARGHAPCAGVLLEFQAALPGVLTLDPRPWTLDREAFVHGLRVALIDLHIAAARGACTLPGMQLPPRLWSQACGV